MIRLEGIIKLRGKVVILEEIENPVLKRILHSRLRESRFNFYGDSGYIEHKTDSSSHSDHTDKYSDNHKDRHNDNYTQYSERQYVDGNESTWYHTDRGHSESVDYGYAEHTDYC